VCEENSREVSVVNASLSKYGYGGPGARRSEGPRGSGEAVKGAHTCGHLDDRCHTQRTRFEELRCLSEMRDLVWGGHAGHPPDSPSIA